MRSKKNFRRCGNTEMTTLDEKEALIQELYELRMLYNAGFANSDTSIKSVKSWRHSDGELCFGGGWFIVCMALPNIGQVSNHYQARDWDMFRIPEVTCAPEWDGHTSKDVICRLRSHHQRVLM